jgi:hypothetical protein
MVFLDKYIYLEMEVITMEDLIVEDAEATVEDLA